MPQMEERTARIEGILEQMSERINDLREELTGRINDLRSEVTERISALERRVDSLDTKFDGLSKEIRDNFKWTLAILIGSWFTIIGVILAKG